VALPAGGAEAAALPYACLAEQAALGEIPMIPLVGASSVAQLDEISTAGQYAWTGLWSSSRKRNLMC
jgi:hypothetical protein